MISRIIKGPHKINFNVWDFKQIYIKNALNRSFVRIDPVEHDELVPLIYALTGSNKMCEHHIKGIYYDIHDNESRYYVNCIGCIDHKDVKKVRKDLISAFFNNIDYIIIDNLSYVEYIPNKGVEIPLDFMAKKRLLTDVQYNLSRIIKEKIERDNEIGLMIVE